MYLQTTDLLAVMIAIISSLTVAGIALVRQIRTEQDLRWWRDVAIRQADSDDTVPFVFSDFKREIDDIIKETEETTGPREDVSK